MSENNIEDQRAAGRIGTLKTGSIGVRSYNYTCKHSHSCLHLEEASSEKLSERELIKRFQLQFKKARRAQEFSSNLVKAKQYNGSKLCNVPFIESIVKHDQPCEDAVEWICLTTTK